MEMSVSRWVVCVYRDFFLSSEPRGTKGKERVSGTCTILSSRREKRNVMNSRGKRERERDVLGIANGRLVKSEKVKRHTMGKRGMCIPVYISRYYIL